MIHITDRKIDQYTNTIVTLGNFDGLHLGHQKLVQVVIELVKNTKLCSVVLSFNPHPVSLIKGRKMPTITTSAEKSMLLEKLGVDLFIEYPFDKSFSQVEPEDFVQNILFKKLKCKTVVVGEEYKFGKDKKGNCTLLQEMGNKLGFEVKIVGHINIDGKKTSSSFIRDMIMSSDFANAQRFLGRPFFVSGNIEKGRKIGRTINFPTVNLLAQEGKLLPPNGVYCTKVSYGENYWEAVTNIGVNPTVENKRKTIETFIFDLNWEIYGEFIEVYFYKRLRGEIKFADINELKSQIITDTQVAKNYFKVSIHS